MAVHMQREEIPDKVRPFVALGFDFSERRKLHNQKTNSNEYFGDCPFCGRQNKFYINESTQQCRCMSAHCDFRRGNVYTFMERWWNEHQDHEGRFIDQFDELAAHKGIPTPTLRTTELVWDNEDQVFALPVRNRNGTVVNIYRYAIPEDGSGGEWRGLPAMQHGMYGAEQLSGRRCRRVTVYVCEGLFDKIAMEQLLDDAGVEGIVVGVPGAGVFKDYWAEWLGECEVVLCYDNDKPGRDGRDRAASYLVGLCETVRTLQWPPTYPEGGDVRDWYMTDGSFRELRQMFIKFKAPDTASLSQNGGSNGKTRETKSKHDLPPLSERKVTIEDTVARYEQHLKMTPDMRDALRVIYAVIYSSQISGDPLWLFIASPPGGAKTELLMSCADCSMVVTRSTLTAHTLVSGFQLKGNRDPSLIPKLIGNVFILKDWTEVLNMNRTHRDEIYGTLRGAYDGLVEKPFGNGTYREYKGYFSMVSGVTHTIYREQMTSLGERFLTFWMKPGNDPLLVVRAAMENVGAEDEIKKDLVSAAKDFLEFKIGKTDLPPLSGELYDRIANLAMVVSTLRASVEKNYFAGGTERIAYRPHKEIGTRLGKQLTKLLLGLGLQHSPPAVTEDDYRIVKRVALSTCNNWNVDALRILAQSDGRKLDDLCEKANIPKTTLREQLENLLLMGAVRKTYEKSPGVGRGPAVYWMSDELKSYWQRAGLPMGKRNTKKK